MTKATRTVIQLVFLSLLWLLVRGVQFLLEVSGLTYEACETSNAELGLQVRIQRQLRALTPKFIKA
ncbi:MAG: hypothetical protein AAGA46_03445 [Cyanobacteria bacterium P01_F01_bin.13]